MNPLLRLLLKNQKKYRDSQAAQSSGGFTMIELLVGMIMAFLILTPLLAFVIDILNNDRREQIKAVTEQDVQAAIDFIAQDLQQAVFIYDNDGVQAIQNTLPSAATAGTPVLVFWKRELVTNTIPINGSSCIASPSPSPSPSPSSSSTKVCDDTYVFSLVAYYLNKVSTTPWSNQARIVRYSIQDCVKDPSNSNQCITANTTLAPLVDASKANGDPTFLPFNINLSGANLAAKMNKWPAQVDGGPEASVTFTKSNVLVDYIDSDSTGLPNCSAGQQVPATPTGGFYACVDASRTLAQVVIRGNALARLQQNTTSIARNSPYFPIVNVQVQGRSSFGQ